MVETTVSDIYKHTLPLPKKTIPRYVANQQRLLYGKWLDSSNATPIIITTTTKLANLHWCGQP